VRHRVKIVYTARGVREPGRAPAGARAAVGEDPGRLVGAARMRHSRRFMNLGPPPTRMLAVRP